MRINGDFLRVIGEYNKNKKLAKTENTQSVSGRKDLMSLSNEAKDYQIARKAISNVPDIREEKIRELEQKYADGTYNVKGRDIAEKMVDKFFDKKI